MDTCRKAERHSRQEMKRFEAMTTKGIQEFQDTQKEFQATQKETFKLHILKEVQGGISNMEDCARHNFTQIDEKLQLGWQCVEQLETAIAKTTELQQKDFQHRETKNNNSKDNWTQSDEYYSGLKPHPTEYHSGLQSPAHFNDNLKYE